MVESSQRCCSRDHTSHRKPDLEGSQEIYGATGEPWDEKHPGALVAKVPPSRLICKEFGLHHQSCNPQCLRTPPSLHSQSHTAGASSQLPGQMSGHSLWPKCCAWDGPLQARSRERTLASGSPQGLGQRLRLLTWGDVWIVTFDGSKLSHTFSDHGWLE